MLQTLSELAGTVQFSQANYVAVMANITKMIDHYRSRRPFIVNVTTFNESLLGGSSQPEVTVTHEVVRVSTNMPPNLTQQERK